MDNELEIKISTNVEQANDKLDKLIDILNKGSSASSNYTDGLKKMKNGFSDLNSKVTNTTSIFSKLLKGLGFTSLTVVARKLFNVFNDGIDSINEYTEILNLFNLVMGNTEDEMSELGIQATKFQNTMAEAFGNNTTNQLSYQSYFQTLTESMGLQEEYAYIISENMTKMTYDISSLFDKSQDDVASALRSGLVGQTKPIRNFGMDITETSLQPILDNLGIDRTVRELNQAEKEIVRYLALLQQSSIAHGDMANTIESPSNQLRVLKNQLVECQKWFSALFINTFGKALPYINGFLMVIKELCKWLGTLFGIEITDYNSSVASYSDDYDDLSDSVDDATDSVKELKRQTLGFDQINNINEDTDSDSDSGSSIGGIDQRLLDAIEGYDNGMESVRMKATEIRDKIMDWLNFTKKIDALTGEVSFEYNGIKGTLKNFWEWFKKLKTEGKLFVGLGIYATIKTIISGVKKLSNVLGTTGLLKNIKNLLTPISSLTGYVKTYTSLAGLEGYTGISKLNQGLKEGVDQWSANLTAVEKLKNTLVGGAGLIVSWSLAYDAVTEFNEAGETNTEVLTRMGISLATATASGALLGATYGGLYGAIAGGLLGALSSLLSYFIGLDTEQDKLLDKLNASSDEIIDFCNEIEEYNKSIDESTQKSLSAITQNENYVKELEKLVDSNGKVKDGYEERVNYILNELNEAYGLEYELIDGQITKNGEYCASMEEVSASIQDVINKKKTELILEANGSKYAKAVETRTEAYKKYQQAIKDVDEAQENFNKTAEDMYYNSNYSNAYQKQYDSLEEFKEALMNSTSIGDSAVETLKETQTALDEAKTTWEENCNTIITYEDLMTASVNGNLEEIETKLKEFTSESDLSLSEQISMWQTYGDRQAEISGEVNDSTYSMLDTTISTLKSQSQTVEELTPEITEAWQTLAETNKEKYVEELKKIPADVQGVLLTEQTQTIEDITQEVVDAWGNLATQNKETFTTKINELPDDVRTTLLGEMEEAGIDIGDDLKKGISEIDTSEETNEVGKNITDGTVKGAEEKAKKKSTWQNFKDSVINWIHKIFGINSPATSMYDTGKYLVLGIVKGMTNNTFPSIFTSWSTNFINSLKEKLGIHSPSKLAMPIGVYTVMGIEEGMEDEIPNIQKTALSMVDTLQTTFDKGMYDLSLESAMTPTLSQNISNLSNISTDYTIDYNSIEQASYNGFTRAIKQYGLVQIDVHQDKGSIVETAIEGINNITKQTGENPIDVW